MADDDTTTPEQTADDDATPEQDAASTAQQVPATDTTEPGEDKLGESGKSALEKERRRAREAERTLREAERARRDLEKKIKQFEDRDKSEIERAAERAADAEKRMQALTERAVRSEVRALAAEGFKDSADAIAFLDLSAYVDDDGEIDSERIKADLADLLERKPHLAKAAAEPEKRRPAPDMTQASSANKQRSSTPADEFAGFLNARLRSRK